MKHSCCAVGPGGDGGRRRGETHWARLDGVFATFEPRFLPAPTQAFSPTHKKGPQESFKLDWNRKVRRRTYSQRLSTATSTKSSPLSFSPPFLSSLISHKSVRGRESGKATFYLFVDSFDATTSFEMSNPHPKNSQGEGPNFLWARFFFCPLGPLEPGEARAKPVSVEEESKKKIQKTSCPPLTSERDERALNGDSRRGARLSGRFRRRRRFFCAIADGGGGRRRRCLANQGRETCTHTLRESERDSFWPSALLCAWQAEFRQLPREAKRVASDGDSRRGGRLEAGGRASKTAAAAAAAATAATKK